MVNDKHKRLDEIIWRLGIAGDNLKRAGDEAKEAGDRAGAEKIRWVETKVKELREDFGSDKTEGSNG